MLSDRRNSDPLDRVASVTSASEFLALIEAVKAISVAAPVARYLRQLTAWTRSQDEIALGVSPRGTLVFYRACQARALIQGRDYVTPDDVQRLAVAALAHRMKTTEHARYAGRSTASLLSEGVARLRVPT